MAQRIWNPFNDFPREFGVPSRVGLLHSMQELIEKVNHYNGKSAIFTSLYAFDEIKNNRGVYSSARIRQIYFDLDSPEDLDSARALHGYCEKVGLMHSMFFSGGGFHFYIATTYPNQLINKKGAVGNAQISIADAAKLTIGVNNHSDIDGHCIGNTAQLVRVPNTYNLRRRLYCVPLRRSDLETDLEEIRERAKRQHSGIFTYGSKFLDLSSFDEESINKRPSFEFDISQGSIRGEIKIEHFPPCIRKLLTEKFIRHRMRYIVILFCRELGLPIETTIDLLRKYLNPRVFAHCVGEERQPYWIYRRQDLNFPSCQTLKNEGLCPDSNCPGVAL
jgi:hypothetical protein